MQYFGFVYLWYDTKNKKYIIGSHHGKLEDSYRTTTGGRYVKNIFKARPETMKRRILEYNTSIDDYKETQRLEQRWLNLRPNIIENDRYYNMKNFATGGVDKNIKRTKPNNWRLKMSEIQKQKAREGTHNFSSVNAKANAVRRLKSGDHHFLRSDFNKKPFKLYKDDVLYGIYESKGDAIRKNIPAGLIDKLRKGGSYTIMTSKSKFEKGTRFKYENLS